MIINIGDRFKTIEGYTVEVIEYINSKNIKIVFLETGNSMFVVDTSLKTRKIKNNYHKSILGVGFIGSFKGPTSIKSRHIYSYDVWFDMLRRCYDLKRLNRYPTYKGCTVAEEWHDFGVFDTWFKNNYPLDLANQGIKFQLDKDLKVKGNKIYSSETCVFLPSKVNGFLTNNQSTNTSGFTGVDYSRGRFQARTTDFDTGRRIYLGSSQDKAKAGRLYIEGRKKQAEKVKNLLRNLNYLPEYIIQNIE